MLAELGKPVSAAGVAARYAGVLDGFVMDEADAGESSAVAVPVLRTPVLMRDLADRDRLARVVLEFADGLGRREP
jgi:LPPG:FO 2-phospho-L-lactate transferase